MLINLSELSQAEGKKEERHVSYEPDSFGFGGNTYSIAEKDVATFKLECISKGKIHVDGAFSMKAVAPCDRCLSFVTVPVEVSFEEDFVLEEMGAELDTDELLYKEILMKWPMKILCDDDCKGICPSCGQNLNLGECGCDRQVLDPRMAAILDVFNNSKN